MGWGLLVEGVLELLLAAEGVLLGCCLSLLGFESLGLVEVGEVKRRDRVAFEQVLCISSDHGEDGTGLDLLILLNVDLHLHRSLANSIQISLNRKILLDVDLLKHEERLNGPSHTDHLVPFLTVQPPVAVAIADQTSH